MKFKLKKRISFALVFCVAAFAGFSLFSWNAKAVDPVNPILPVESSVDPSAGGLPFFTPDPSVSGINSETGFILPSVDELGASSEVPDPATAGYISGSDPAVLPSSDPAADPAPVDADTAEKKSPAPEVSSNDDARINDFMGYVMGMLMQFSFRIASLILAAAGKLLNWAFSIQTFKGIAAVDTTWKVLRDLCNMFFIVILMISAIATILRVSKYQFTSILRNLLIAIIAINFSKTITYAVVDFTQVLSRSFLAVAGAAETDAGMFQISEQLANNMGMTAIFKAPAFWSDDGNGMKFLGTWDMALSTLFSAVVMLVAGVAFAVGAVMLVVRLVMIWILIAVSSGAWGLYAFPDLHHYYTKWWGMLRKYAFFAPNFAFFVGFALILVRGGGYPPMKGSLLSDSGPTDFFRPSGYLLNYIITIIILWYAINSAKGMDQWGGKAVDWVANKGQGLLKSPAMLTMPRTRAAIMAEHKARKEMRESLKKETAQEWAQKAYKYKDIVHKEVLVDPGTRFREFAREIPKLKNVIDEKGKMAKILNKRGYESKEEDEANKKRVEKLRDFKDNPPSADKIKNALDPVKGKNMNIGERMAIAQYLANNVENFDNTTPDSAYEQFQEALEILGKKEALKKEFINDIKKTRVDILARHEDEKKNKGALSSATLQAEMDILLEQLTDKGIANQDIAAYKNSAFKAFVNASLTKPDLRKAGASWEKLNCL